MDVSRLVVKRIGSQPLYTQLLLALEARIEQGALPAGARLPSERDLAEQLDLSRTTVANAYRELVSRGLARGHVGRGTFVCAQPEPGDAPFAWRGKIAAGAQRTGDPAFRYLMRDAVNPNLISFALGTPAIECFPRNEFLRVAEQVMRREADRVMGLGPTEGQPCLRRALAARMEVRQERVLVVSGSQQGLDLLARCLLDPGDTVVMDRPSYVGAIQTFRSAGANLVGWDMARADLDELEDLIVRYRPKLLYVNPTFQNPTGRTLTLAERRDLLRLAARYRLPLIEDDAYRELYLDGPPPPSLYHLDQYNVVIYLNTFSKMMAPGLRLGWLVAAESIVEQLALIKQGANSFTEGLGQFVMAEFLESGLLDEHLQSLRIEHSKRRQALINALKRHLPPKALTLDNPKGGIYFWCRLGQGLKGRQLLPEAIAAGVVFANGELFYPDQAGTHEIRLCFSSVPAGQMEEGVRRLAECFQVGKSRQLAQQAGTLPLV